MNATVTKLLNPLKSRKVQTAIATLVVAYAAEWGFNLNDAQVLGIVALGATIITGIAIEDHGTKSAGRLVTDSKVGPTLQPLQPLQALTAEPIAPAVGEAVKAAIEPLSKTLLQVLDERRKEQLTKHTSTVVHLNGNGLSGNGTNGDGKS